MLIGVGYAVHCVYHRDFEWDYEAVVYISFYEGGLVRDWSATTHLLLHSEGEHGTDVLILEIQILAIFELGFA